ncbi:MAG: hypothetical protein M3O29_01660 [Actinomycetota bacterium]|nr:hypothetical protein [Actinomycetota bacterium]
MTDVVQQAEDGSLTRKEFLSKLDAAQAEVDAGAVLDPAVVGTDPAMAAGNLVTDVRAARNALSSGLGVRAALRIGLVPDLALYKREIARIC